MSPRATRGTPLDRDLESTCGIAEGGLHTVAERLRAAIEGTVVQTAGRIVRVTASFGVASIACSGPDRSALLTVVDGRLYEAKRAGRNRVVG